MKTAWIASLVLLAIATQAADIASVDLKKLEPELKEYIFAKPQYADLKKKSETTEDFNPMKDMKTDGKGNLVFSQEQLRRASSMHSKYEVDKAVRDAMRRELVVILEGMKLKHAVIFNGDDESALLYSQAEIEDITHKVYQELVKRLDAQAAGNKKTAP